MKSSLEEGNGRSSIFSAGWRKKFQISNIQIPNRKPPLFPCHYPGAKGDKSGE
jgi:hypothetical protein